jgi:nicotinamide-nucleotide amidase
MTTIPKAVARKIRSQLLKKHQTIAVAESATAGLLQFALSTIQDASQFFQGGITTYNVGQKYKHLAVEPIHALDVNCVSNLVAKQMALACCRLFSSHWGIGVTGYATPVPSSGNKLFAYYAIAYNGKIKLTGMIRHAGGEPTEVQEAYVMSIIRSFSNQLHS